MPRASRAAALATMVVLVTAAPACAGTAQAGTAPAPTHVTGSATHAPPGHAHRSKRLVRDPSGKLVHALGKGHVRRTSGQSGGPAPVAASGTSAPGNGCTFQTPGYTAHYCHAGAYQSPFDAGDYYTVGAHVLADVDAPTVASSDYHSLWELAVEDFSQKQIIEVGWRVYGPSGPDPQLFVNYWKDGVSAGYGNGFVSTTSLIGPGMYLPTGTTKQFGIEYYQGNWWVYYDTTWFGYFPGTIWGGWGSNDLTQTFGEVSAGELYPCTDMGSGVLPGYSGAAHVSNFGWYGPGPAVNLQPGTIEDPLLYDAWVDYTGTGFTYGGPGDC
ncbi:MAG: hypothetical protein ACJ74O_04065 [Frankiaceae bacterium]